MTNRERLNSEVDNFRHMILGKLNDDALDAGDAELAWGYLWLRDNVKWPVLIENYGGWDWIIQQVGDDRHSHGLLSIIADNFPHFRERRMENNGIPAYRRSESAALEAAARAAAKALIPKE